jgi:hypothetical protein
MLGKDSQLKGSIITPLLGIAITFIKLVDVLVYALPIFLKRAKCTMVVGAEDNSKCRHLPMDPVHILGSNALTVAIDKTPHIITIISLPPCTLHSMVQQGGMHITVI